MRRDLLRTSSFVLAFVGSVGLAAAQQPPPPADAQQQSQQEAGARPAKPRPIAQQTPSGKMGKEEPSSHTPNDMEPTHDHSTRHLQLRAASPYN